MFLSRNIDANVGKNLLKTYVWNVVLYGSETWIMGKTEEKILLALETWCYGKFLRISWTITITNEEMYRRAVEIRKFLKTLKTRRAK